MSDNTLLVNPDQDWFGEITIIINVTDGEYIDSDEFILEISPVNDAPVISGIGDQSIEEDSSFIYSIVAYDADGDDLIYSIDEISKCQCGYNWRGIVYLLFLLQDYYG